MLLVGLKGGWTNQFWIVACRPSGQGVESCLVCVLGEVIWWLTRTKVGSEAMMNAANHNWGNHGLENDCAAPGGQCKI